MLTLQYLETWTLPLSSNIFLDWILGNQFRPQNRIIQNSNSNPLKAVEFISNLDFNGSQMHVFIEWGFKFVLHLMQFWLNPEVYEAA